MTRSSEDIMAARSARLVPGSAAQQDVFEKAYDIALQVIELRKVNRPAFVGGSDP